MGTFQTGTSSANDGEAQFRRTTGLGTTIQENEPNSEGKGAVDQWGTPTADHSD